MFWKERKWRKKTESRYPGQGLLGREGKGQNTSPGACRPPVESLRFHLSEMGSKGPECWLEKILRVGKGGKVW